MSHSKSTSFQWIRFSILCVLHAVIIYPLLLLVLIPVNIYRCLVKLIVKFIDPTCGEMITGISACLIGSSPYDRSFATLAPYVLFSEKVDLNKVKQLVNEKIIKPNLYPELKQRVISKFGYTFWKNVDNFSLDHHVQYLYPNCPNKPVPKSDIRGSIGDSVVYQPFDKRFSPWQLLVIPNVFDLDNQTVKSAIIFRYHHGMMDGLSGVKFCQRTAAKPWDWPVAKALAKKSTKSTFASVTTGLMNLLKLVVTGPYHAVNNCVYTNDTNEFIQEALKVPKKLSLTDIYGPRKELDPKRESVQVLNQIRQKYNVGMSSVITAVVVEGVAEFVRKRCSSGFSRLPKNFITHMVVPLPGHPETKLVNHWSVVRMPVKMSETGDPVETMKRINVYYKQLATSAVPIANYLIFEIVAMLPLWIRPDPKSIKIQQTILFSNFAGPKSDSECFGYKGVDWSLLGSSPLGSAVILMAQTISGKFWIDAGGVRKLFPEQEDLQQIENCLHDVIKELKMRVLKD